MSKQNKPAKGKKNAPKKASEPTKPAAPSTAASKSAAKAPETEPPAKGGILSRLAGRFLGKLKGQPAAQPAKTAAGQGAADAPAKGEKAASKAAAKPTDNVVATPKVEAKAPKAEAAKAEPKAETKPQPKAEAAKPVPAKAEAKAEAKKPEPPAPKAEAAKPVPAAKAAEPAPKPAPAAKVEAPKAASPDAEASTLPARDAAPAKPAAKPEPKAELPKAPTPKEAPKAAPAPKAEAPKAATKAEAPAAKAPAKPAAPAPKAEAKPAAPAPPPAAKKAEAPKPELKPEPKPAVPQAAPPPAAAASKPAVPAAPKAAPVEAAAPLPKSEPKEAKPAPMPKPEAPSTPAPAPQAAPAPAFASASAQSVSDFAHAAMKAEQAPSSSSVYVVPAAKKSAGFTSEAILARFELEPAHPHTEPNYGPPEDWGMEIDEEYGDTKIAVLARDPEWAYAYWEISPADRLHYALPRGGVAGDNALALRVRKLNAGAAASYDLEVGNATTWYLQLEPNASYQVDLGYRDALGRFFALASSSKLNMPRNQPSDQTSAESDWMIVEEEFEKIFQASGGEVVAVERRVGSGFVTDLARLPEGPVGIKTRPFLTFPVGASEQLLSSGSGGVAGVKLPPAKKKDFWLRVRTELILYGETEADAKVTVSGEAINLRPDGSFTLRYAFPEGVIELPVVAVNADGDMVKSVTPVAERTTKDINL